MVDHYSNTRRAWSDRWRAPKMDSADSSIVVQQGQAVPDQQGPPTGPMRLKVSLLLTLSTTSSI